MKIICLSINSENNLSGLPKWEYSLAFAYLQAYFTKSNYYSQTNFINLIYYESIDPQIVINDISNLKADVLAISCYIWNIDKVLQIIPIIKKHNKNFKIILGGPEFSSESSNILNKNNNIDIIIYGEGEKTFKEIIEYYYNNKIKKLNDINGIIFKDINNNIICTNKRPLIQKLDKIPSPYLSGIVNLKKLKNKLVAIESQRGCICDCAYCNYQKGNKGIRYFSLNRVKKELKLIFSFSPKQLYLMDPTFNSNKKRAKGILNTIITNNNNTILNAEMLPDMLDKEIIELSKSAGMRTVEIGIQSLNKKAVKIMNRYRNEKKLFENIHIAINTGLYLVPQIIFGLPGDNIDSFFKTFNRIYDLPTEELELLHLLLLPGTHYRKNAKKYNIIFDNAPPYKIISSNDFTKNEINFLANFSKIVLATQPLKIVINKINKTMKFKYHELFNEFIMQEKNSNLDFNWPIHTLNDKENAIKIIDKFYNFYNKQISDLNDENIIKLLYQKKRQAQIILAARYINLPKNKKIFINEN